MDTFQANAKTKKERVTILSHLPHSPGVYEYRDSEGTIIYIGKAVDLYKRVHQYFRSSLLSPKTKKLVSQIVDIQIHKTLSEFDALLLEAKLIYEYQPKYNVLAKDDKSPLYVKLTVSEQLPRILYIRKPRTPSYGTVVEDGDIVFGPFQSAKMVRSLMRALRRIIPYCTQNKRSGHPCFYTQIGLCHPCPSEIMSVSNQVQKQQQIQEYRQHIFKLRDLLSGKSSSVRMELEKEMRFLASKQEFEKAAVIRNQLNGLNELLSKRYDPMLYVGNDSVALDMADTEMQSLREILIHVYPTISTLNRIECIDISNTSGQFATGSMVVLSNGIPDNAQYRRFKIRQDNVPNDVGMIEEVIRRRFSHDTWSKPNLFIVDGGKPQVLRASAVFKEISCTVPLIGLAKRREEIVVEFDGHITHFRLSLTDPAIHILQRIRDEAHRFAIGYHKKLRQKGFMPED
jgi:excinuclease ABC subunit C